MTEFLIKLTLCWFFFALLYHQLLRGETFFRANRLYLLATLLASIGLAAIPGEQIPGLVYEGGAPVTVMPVFTVGLHKAQSAASQLQMIDYLWFIYWVGVVMLAARMFWGLFRLGRMCRTATPIRLNDGSVVLETTETATPFSFFNWVFVPAGMPLEAPVLVHERAHVRAGHSADVMLCELLCVLFWFHPLAHWYKKALRTVHEYQADAAASCHSNKKQYGLLLIRQSQSGMPVAFANHFFQSPLKQRLVMLTKKTSSPVRALKFGLTAPVAILFALMFRQAPAIAQVVQQVNTEQSKKTEAVPGASVQTPAKKETAASKSADAEPSFPGGTNDLMKYLAEHLRYPEAAQKDKAEGMVVLQFMVQKDGSLKDITVLQTAHKNHPALEEEALRVVKSMPKWKPAVKNGKIAKMQYTLPIRFKLDQDDPAENAYDVEKMPVYPGGEIEMMRFLASNVKYPESARKDGITGMVAIQFIVEKDGSLTNFETLRTPSPDCAAEAIRVLKLMPKFEPGIKGGSPVRVKYTLPIRFEF